MTPPRAPSAPTGIEVVEGVLDDSVPGVRRWRHPVTGREHRLTGPAVTTGRADCWYFDGQLHREGGPAVSNAGRLEWYVHGGRHRVDGPAVSCPRGGDEWWVGGAKVASTGGSPEDVAVLEDLVAAGRLMDLEQLLALWHPDGASVSELAAAVAAARV